MSFSQQLSQNGSLPPTTHSSNKVLPVSLFQGESSLSNKEDHQIYSQSSQNSPSPTNTRNKYGIKSKHSSSPYLGQLMRKQTLEKIAEETPTEQKEKEKTNTGKANILEIIKRITLKQLQSMWEAGKIKSDKFAFLANKAEMNDNNNFPNEVNQEIKEINPLLKKLEFGNNQLKEIQNIKHSCSQLTISSKNLHEEVMRKLKKMNKRTRLSNKGASSFHKLPNQPYGEIKTKLAIKNPPEKLNQRTFSQSISRSCFPPLSNEEHEEAWFPKSSSTFNTNRNSPSNSRVETSSKASHNHLHQSANNLSKNHSSNAPPKLGQIKFKNSKYSPEVYKKQRHDERQAKIMQKVEIKGLEFFKAFTERKNSPSTVRSSYSPSRVKSIDKGHIKNKKSPVLAPISLANQKSKTHRKINHPFTKNYLQNMMKSISHDESNGVIATESSQKSKDYIRSQPSSRKRNQPTPIMKKTYKIYGDNAKNYFKKMRQYGRRESS